MTTESLVGFSKKATKALVALAALFAVAALCFAPAGVAYADQEENLGEPIDLLAEGDEGEGLEGEGSEESLEDEGLDEEEPSDLGGGLLLSSPGGTAPEDEGAPTDLEDDIVPGLKAEAEGVRYLESDGEYVANEWRDVDGATYYFGADGYALVGLNSIDGKTYYFNDDAQLGKGWITWSDGTKSYASPEDGCALMTGWSRIDNRTYYFDESTFKSKKGLAKIDGKTYYFNSSSQKCTGWIKRSDGSRSYASAKHDGALAKGWWTIDGKKYYFNPNTLSAARYKTVIGGKTYYFNASGQRCVGWVNWKGGTSSYFSKSTGAALKGKWYVSGVLIDFGTTGIVRVDKDKLAMGEKAQKYSAKSRYLMLVNTDTKRVGVFEKDSNDVWRMKKYWACTVGAKETPTYGGSFELSGRGKSFGEENGYSCWYWTRIHDSILFHSVLYNPYSMTSVQDGRLGIAASHGCIRLALNNAKWVYQNAVAGTAVKIYD